MHINKGNLFKHLFHYLHFNRNQHNAAKFLMVKTIAKNLVKSIGVPVVKQLKAFTPLEQIVFTEATVIKPSFEANSAGVFLIHTHNEITDLYGSSILKSYDELLHVAKTYLQKKIIKQNRWNVEELVKGINNSLPPHEIKFFCFYDVVAMVLERKIDPLFDALNYRRTFYNDKREVFYSDHVNKALIEESFPESYYQTALHIAKHLPVPFIRIDFIRTDTGLLFSEFEMQPGSFRHLPEALLLSYTHYLGNYFTQALEKINTNAGNGVIIPLEKLLHYAVQF